MADFRTSGARIFWIYILTIVLSVSLAYLIRFSLIEIYRVTNPYLSPTLLPGDTVLTFKPPFGLKVPGFTQPWTQGRLPKRGELVIFALPGDETDTLRRVVGLPGDRVAIKAGKLSLGGKVVTQISDKKLPCGQEALPDGPQYTVCWEDPIIEDFGSQTIPDGQVLVVGDLRSEKKAQLIPVSALKARAVWLWLSIAPPDDEETGFFKRLRLNRIFKRIPS